MSARAWTLFAAVSVIWGMPYLFIKIAVDELSPSLVAWSRLAIAAAVLLPVAWKLGALRGLAARWKTLTVFAAVEMAVPWPLLGFGEVHVSSSLAAILIAAVPLFVALLATRFDHSERPEFVYTHAWRVGDLLVWDNRCSMHARTDFPSDQRRLMLRTTVKGTERPC